MDEVGSLEHIENEYFRNIQVYFSLLFQDNKQTMMCHSKNFSRDDNSLDDSKIEIIRFTNTFKCCKKIKPRKH